MCLTHSRACKIYFAVHHKGFSSGWLMCILTLTNANLESYESKNKHLDVGMNWKSGAVLNTPMTALLNVFLSLEPSRF